MVITINRKAYKAFKKTYSKPELLEYIKEEVASDIENYGEGIYLDDSEITEMSLGIISVINRNEKVIKKYGMEKYLNDDFPAKDYVSGYYYRTGTLILCPFDWSLYSDGEFDYSFTLARSL